MNNLPFSLFYEKHFNYSLKPFQTKKGKFIHEKTIQQFCQDKVEIKQEKASAVLF